MAGHRRFLAVTPPFFCRQKIYDRASKKIITASTRDHVDWFTLKQIFLDEDYNLRRLRRYKDIEEMYANLLAESKTPLILDIGGNIGLAAIYFQLIFPAAKIISVEPDKGNFLQAQENIKSSNISLIEAAVSSADGTGDFADHDAPNNAFRVIENPRGKIPFLSIETILNDINTSNGVPFLIKIDIEGHENALFSNNTNWLDKFPILIIELHDWMLPKQANSQPFLSAISKLNRDFVYLGENIFSLANK
jgi:FkbM family methyltransferase